MKNLSIIILSIFVSLFIQCSPNQESTQSQQTPELLERSNKLQYANEWPEVKNRYADLKHKLGKEPNNVEALLSLTQLFIAEARVTGEHGHYYGSALKIVNRILEDQKISKDQKFLALSYKSSVQLSLHDFKNAKETAMEALILNAYNAQIYGAIVDACVELGQYKEAVEWADKMNALRPDIRSYSRISYLREIHGMPEEAIEALKLAVLAGSPGSEEKSWAALQLSNLILKYKSTEEAEDILKQILEERENYPFALASIAEIRIKQGKYDEAEKILKEACEVIPEVGFFVSLAQIYKIQSRKPELNKILKEIELMIQDDISHGHNMSLEWANIQLEYFENPNKALALIQDDYKMRPDNIEVNKLMVSIYQVLSNKEKVKEYLTKALITGSKDPELQVLSSNF